MADKARVLVVIDPTADVHPALERGAAVARWFDVPLELFICDYSQQLAAHPLFDQAGLEQARRAVLDAHVERLEALAEPLRAGGQMVRVDARSGRPVHRGILDKIADAAPLLVVKDTHHHDALERTLLSNTDWHLIRTCPAPLMLVKPRAIGTPPKVLAAVDPMHEHEKPAALDHAIVSFAAELARRSGGTLHVLHVYDTAPVLAAATASTPVAMSSVPVAELTEALANDHREALDRLLDALPPLDAAEVTLEQGTPSRCIAQKAAADQIDFVVMGAVSRGALQRIFIGSTAEQTLDRLPCDLVIVKQPGFAPPHD